MAHVAQRESCVTPPTAIIANVVDPDLPADFVVQRIAAKYGLPAHLAAAVVALAGLGTRQ